MNTLIEVLSHPALTNILLFCILLRSGARAVYHYKTGAQ